MSDEPEPLDPDVLGVLRRAKAVDPINAAARARVLAGVDARIAALPSGGGGGDRGGSEDGSKFGQPNRPAGSPSNPIGKLLAARPLASIALALAVGGAAGALLRGAPEARVVYVDRAVPVVVASPASAAATAPAAPASPALDADALPSASASARATAAPLDAGAALAAESALLDVARTALARGEPDHALAAVGRHAAQFPHGVLAEEREALAVKALAQEGRGADARARADRFRARYPESLFSTAIDSSLQDVREMDRPRPPQP
jgi:hypothetical protein